jgi:hypothetical protein
MIRLLEIPKLSDSKSFEGGHRHGRVPAIRNVSRLEVHLTSKREAVAAAYLRAAHAYILISMPTGTSTIFGVFQAILALLLNRTNSVLADKVMRNEKFASEIFCHKPLSFMLHRKMKSQICAARRQNKGGSIGSELLRQIRMLTVAGFPTAAPTEVDFAQCRGISSTPASETS